MVVPKGHDLCDLCVNGEVPPLPTYLGSAYSGFIHGIFYAILSTFFNFFIANSQID